MNPTPTDPQRSDFSASADLHAAPAAPFTPPQQSLPSEAQVAPEVQASSMQQEVQQEAQTPPAMQDQSVDQTANQNVTAAPEQPASEVAVDTNPSTDAETSAAAESNTHAQISASGELVKSQYFNNSIFWIEVEKIVPNPYQPRKEFDQHALKDLSESIRMYGLLQPLVVTRKEIIKEDGGLAVRYELISGERRLRASRLAGLAQVPVIIRAGEEDARVKLELAIIENLQREDLNPVDRARSFQRLSEEFGLKHQQIAEKMGKSREYVTNTIRLLALPPHMLDALSEKKISEGHSRPLLMLSDRPEEQEVLFKEITYRKMTVREAERIARGVAVERVRKHDINETPELKDLERKLNDALGTRVFIDKKEQGGKVVIDFFNLEDVRHFLERLTADSSASGSIAHGLSAASPAASISAQAEAQTQMADLQQATALDISGVEPAAPEYATVETTESLAAELSDAPTQAPVDDSNQADQAEDESLYSIKNFSI